MKRTKKLLSFFLAIMMVITTIPAFTLTTNAADWSGNLTTTDSAGYRYYAGHDVFNNNSKRINSSGVSGAVTPTINVCNDGERGNFCAGLWVFDMNSNIPTSIKSLTATLTIKVINANGDSRGVNFYITGDTPSNVNNSSSLNGNADSVKAVKGYFNSTGLTLVRSVAQSEVNQTKTYTIDVSELVKNARLNGWNRFNVLAIQETAGDKNSNGTRWSDLHIEKPTIYVNAVEKKLSTTASAEDNENSSTYRVVLDDAIYTFESESAYYNYGTNISTLDPWDTQVVCKSGSPSDISSIVCLDSGAVLSLNGTNQLQGNLLADKFKVSGKTDVNATLLFTFKDGTKEYHRVAVKSYPVETHICSVAVRDTSSETGYTMFMRGSTGAGGTGVWKYYKSYYTSGTTAHGFPDGTGNSYTTGKMAMIYAYSYSDYWNSRDAVPTVGTATYYIDKSCYTYSTWAGLGNSEYWYGSNYVIPIDVVRTKFGYGSGTNNSNFDINNMPVASSIPKPSSIDWTDRNGLTNRLTFTHNASVNSSNRWTNANDTTCNLRLALRRTDRGYALYKTNVIVNLFDKSTARKKYDDLIKLDLKENNYTASSFATYQNALLNMEAYLSNYEDTSEAKAGVTVYDNLVDAYSKLVPRTTEAQYQELLTLDQKYKTAKSHATSAPIDRPYTNTSYNNFLNAYFDNSTDQAAAEQALAKYEAGTMDKREFAQSTYTTYKNAYNALLDFLVERADFGYYDEQADAVAGNLTNYTAKDGQYIRLYSVLEPYKSITLYTDAQKIETPKTSQITVNNAGQVIAEANTGVNNSTPVDQTALKAFIDQNFDLDVVDNTNITTQKENANGLYETVPFNGTNYYSLNVENQAELDSNIAGYINSINSTIGKYDIQVPAGIEVTAGGVERTADSTADGISTYRLTYGVPITFTSTNKETAWYMSYVSNVAKRGKQYQCSGETYATKVMGNMTVTPKSNSDNNTPNKVTVIRQYSNGGNTAMLIDYVGNSFTLPAVQTYPNYTFTGYEVNGKAYNAGGTEVTITGDTVIYAKYDALGSDCAITITKTDGTTTTENYKYNSVVNLSDSNAYAWIEKPINSNDWRPSYIGTGCSYKVTEPMELKAVTKAQFNDMFTDEAYAPNLRANGPLVADGIGVVFHGQFINYVPAGAEIVEYGVAVNVNNANSFDLINTNGKVIRCKSTNPMKSNQFSVGARYNGNTFTNSTTISYRSYMIYQITVNGQLETKYVYSDVRHFPENA